MVKRLPFTLAKTHVAVALLALFLIGAQTYLLIFSDIETLAKSQQELNQSLVEKSKALVADGRLGKEEKSLLDGESGRSGVLLKITGPEEKILYDNSGRRSTHSVLVWEGKFVTRNFNLDSGYRLNLKYFRPFLASDRDKKFVYLFNRFIFFSSFLTLGFAFASAWLVDRKIRKDLARVNELALYLLKGSYLAKLPEAPRYGEFQSLTGDLTELRDKWLKEEQLKKRMTADFAHELRTPLTTLQTHLEALIEGVWEPSRERFVSCHEEILRLIRLVGNLEQLNKYEEETFALNKSDFDLSELVKHIYINFQGEFKNNNITFSFNGSHQVIHADRDKISQVVVNLLSNSLKYTPRNGKILVNMQGNREYVYLIVNDNGVGIPENDVANIFKRLYRSDTSRTRSSGGAGIGLTIAKTIIEAHKGSIDVVSQEGAGTEFMVILPRR